MHETEGPKTESVSGNQLLEFHARPWQRDEPVICLDEKSTQLLGDSRPPLPMRPGVPARHPVRCASPLVAGLLCCLGSRLV
jgi:hypothetical protein